MKPLYVSAVSSAVELLKRTNGVGGGLNFSRFSLEDSAGDTDFHRRVEVTFETLGDALPAQRCFFFFFFFLLSFNSS